MLKLMPTLAAFGLMVGGVARAEGSLFERAQGLFSAGSKPMLERFSADAMWAGKCVTLSEPDHGLPGVAHVVYETPTSTSESVHMINVVDLSERLDYVHMPLEEALRQHESSREFLPHFSPLMGSDDPLAMGLTFTYRNGSTRVDMTLRNGATAEGLPLQLLSVACGGEQCTDSNGHVLRRGQVGMYCYYWVDRLAGPVDFDAGSTVDPLMD
jgi:hypothetical protein